MDLDLSGDRLKRRHDAFKRYYTDYIQKKYRNDEYIDTIVATHLIMNIETFDDYDFTHCISTAAAIWVLDELRKNGNLDVAMKLLPKDYREFIYVDLPDGFVHECYENDLILSMIDVLKNRNGESVTFFVDEYSAKGTRADNEFRKRADALFALLDEESIDRACKRFKEKQAELEERFMEGFVRLKREQNSISENLQNKDFESVIVSGITKAFNTLERQKELQKKQDKIACYALDYGSFTAKSYKENMEEFGIVKVAKLTSGFHVDDPYETYFIRQHRSRRNQNQIPSHR